MAAIAPAAELGWQAADFRLRGTDGAWHHLGELAGARGTVVAFICNHCPYVKAVLPRLLRDARELLAHGVKVIAINANDAVAYPEDSFERMVEIAGDWPFPYLHDESQQIARTFGAVCTPDFFGFDAKLRLQYRGRLDASLKASADSEAARELFAAMCMIAKSGQGPAQQHAGMGCSIKWRG